MRITSCFQITRAIFIVIIYLLLLTPKAHTQVVEDTLYVFPDSVVFLDNQNGLILDWMANFAVKFNIPVEVDNVIIKKVGFLFYNREDSFIFDTNFKISVGNNPEELILFEQNVSIDSTTTMFQEWQLYALDSTIKINNDSSNNSFFISGLIFLRTALSPLTSYAIPNEFIFHAYNQNWVEASHEYFPVKVIVEKTITGIQEDLIKADNFYLYQNYPNPFNPITTIRYALPQDGIVTIKIFDILGQEIATLKNEFQKANRYEVKFDSKGFASGVYIYRIQVNNYLESKKMILLK